MPHALSRLSAAAFLTILLAAWFSPHTAAQTAAADEVVFEEDFENAAKVKTSFKDGKFIVDEGRDGKGMLVQNDKDSIWINVPLPAERLRGCTVELSASARGENISQKPKGYNGIKLQFGYTTEDGKKEHPMTHLPVGTFGWKNYSVQATFPHNLKTAAFTLGLEAVTGKVWYDDVVVKVVSAPSASCAPVAAPGQSKSSSCKRNLLRSSSFETGFEWYSLMRGIYLDDGKTDPVYLPPVIDSAEKHHGAASLRIDNPDGDSWRLSSNDIALSPGASYTLSFWMKASVPGMMVRAALIGRENNDWSNPGKTFTLTNEWKHYEAAIAVPANHSYYFLAISNQADGRKGWGGTLWIDAAQLVEGTDGTYKPPEIEVGVVKSSPRYYTLSAAEDYPVIFKMRNNGTTPREVKVKYSVYDEYFERTALTSETPVVSAAADSTTDITVSTISPKLRGKFILTFDAVDAKSGDVLGSGDLDFAVIDAVRRTTPVEGFTVCGQFSVCADWFTVGWANRQTWYALGCSPAEQFDYRMDMGDRWVRLWGGGRGDLSMGLVEPEEGKFEWTSVDKFVDEGMRRGMRFMGTLGSTLIVEEKGADKRYEGAPKWIQDRFGLKPSAGSMKATVCLPSIEVWKSYVAACVTRYKGKITHWEVFNEPNLWMSSAEYNEFLKAAYETVKRIDPEAKVVGFCATGDLGGEMGEFVKGCLDTGAKDYFDILSFHPYSSRQEASPFPAEKAVAQLKEILAAHGQEKKEIWNSELFYLTPEPLKNEYFTSLQIKGHEAARRFLIDLASGVSKSFCVVDNSYCQKINAIKSWNDRSDKPTPNRLFVIYNTLAKHFEGATFVSQIPLTGESRLYVFEKGGAPIAAAWNYGKDIMMNEAVFPGAEGKLSFLDAMGNRIEPTIADGVCSLPIQNSPFYITPISIEKPAFLALLNAARIEPGVPVSVAAGMTFVDGKPSLLVEAENITPEQATPRITIEVPGGEFAAPGELSDAIPAGGIRSFTLPITMPQPWNVAKVIAHVTAGKKTATLPLTIRYLPCVNVPKAAKPMTVDGSAATEEWAGAARAEIKDASRLKLGPKSWKGPEDCSATVFFSYDANALYIAAKVVDDVRGDVAEKKYAWSADGVELFIDAKPDKKIGNSKYSPCTYQLLFAMPTPRFPEILAQKSGVSGSPLKVEDVAVKTTSRDGGYDVEFAIPWKSLAVEPVSGMTIGFDIAVDDADDAEGRKTQMVWAGEGDNWGVRANFGRLVLE